MNKEEFLEYAGITERQFLGLDTINRSLYLRNLTSIPEGFNPTVERSLYLPKLTSIPEGFNPTVGGHLDLCSLTSLPKGFNPIVGESLLLNSLTSIPEGFNKSNYEHKDISSLLSWGNGKYVKVDGIFTEVLHTRGNIRKVRKLNSDKEFYLVTDGKGNYAHGDTLKEANRDLLFKITKRDKSDYKSLTLDSILSFNESVICYRVITGACQLGTNDFIKNRLKDTKDEFSIAEIIELTKNEYKGEEFKEFFDK